MGRLVRSLGAGVSALPDAITAAVFLFAWLHPMTHPGLPAQLMLVMMIEFLAVHSAGMMGMLALSPHLCVFQRPCDRALFHV